MMKRLLFFLLTLLPLWVQAQTSIHEEVLKNAAEYIVGQGWAETVKEADREALANLMSKISVQESKIGRAVQQE